MLYTSTYAIILNYKHVHKYLGTPLTMYLLKNNLISEANLGVVKARRIIIDYIPMHDTNQPPSE